VNCATTDELIEMLFKGFRLMWAQGTSWNDGGAHWHHLASTTERSVCGGDAALRQITLSTCCDSCWWQEKLVIEAIKKQLQAQISDSFEQLCRLQEARQQVLADLQDKNIALDIDIEQYNLTEDSPDISYKPDPTRVPKG